MPFRRNNSDSLESEAHRRAIRKNQLAQIHANFEYSLIEKQAQSAKTYFEKQAILFKNRHERLKNSRQDKELQKYLGELHLDSRPVTSNSEISVNSCFERAKTFDTYSRSQDSFVYFSGL